MRAVPSSLLLALATGGFALAHRDAGAVQAEVGGRSRGRVRGVRGAGLVPGNGATDGFGRALDMLGSDRHPSQFLQQGGGFREADHRGRRGGHALHGRGQVRARHPQGRVPRETAMAAGAAMVVGTLERDRPQGAHEGLAMPPGEARRAAAGARLPRPRVIAEVRIQALFQQPCRLRQRLEVEALGRARGYEPRELLLERRGELLRAGFFFTTSGASPAAAPAKRAWHSCSLTSTSSLCRRHSRWNSSV